MWSKKYETLISIIYSVEAPPSESEQSQIEEGIEEDESEIEKSLDHSSGRIFFQIIDKYSGSSTSSTIFINI